VHIGSDRGDNIVSASSENEAMKWYDGWTLGKKEKRSGKTVSEAIRAQIQHFGAKREMDKPFVMPIASVTDKGVIGGKVEQGTVSKSGTLTMAMSGVEVSIETLHRRSCSMETVNHGDCVSMTVSKMASTATVGDVIYSKSGDFEVSPCSRITALVAMVSSGALEVGKFEGAICIRSNVVQCTLSKIHYKMVKDGKKEKKEENAQSLNDKEQGLVEFTLKAPMIVTSFKHCESLGRFVVLHENRTVLQGKIESVAMEQNGDDDDGDYY